MAAGKVDLESEMTNVVLNMIRTSQKCDDSGEDVTDPEELNMLAMEEKYGKSEDSVLEAVAADGFKVVAGSKMYKRFYLWLNSQTELKAAHDQKSRDEKAEERATWARKKYNRYAETGWK